MQDGMLIKVGDAVVLCMLPGDEALRVARLQALWSLVVLDGCERMFAQCCLFHRPAVCFPSSSTHDIERHGLSESRLIQFAKHGIWQMVPECQQSSSYIEAQTAC